MSPVPDVLVIGGGIAGLTTALAAASRALDVMVLDIPLPGAASRTAAGMLAPSLEGLPGEVTRAALAARDSYPEFLAELHERTGVAVPLNRNGILELAESSDHLHLLRSRAARDAVTLGERALAELEPAFTGHAGAVLHPGDGAVDNVVLMDALELAVRAERRITRVMERAVALECDAGAVGVRTERGSHFQSPRVVLAGGAWLAQLTGLPRTFPVRPVRGQLLTLDRAPISHVTYGGGGYLVPRGRRLLVGATSEDTGFGVETSASGLAQLQAIASRAIPSLSGASVAEHWAGLRPMSPDGMPVLGRDPGDERLLYAGAFSRNGILFAPWAASQLAADLAGEASGGAMAPFSIARFARSE